MYKIVVICLLVCNFGYASVEQFPPVNEQTIVGEWEAFTNRGRRVYRMSISDNSPSLLVVAISERICPVYKLKETEFKKERFSLIFVEESEEDHFLTITGSGVSDPGGNKGSLFCEVSIKENDRVVSEWSVEFCRRPYIDELRILSEIADRRLKEKGSSIRGSGQTKNW